MSAIPTSQNTISFPPDQLRQSGRQISSLSDALNQQLTNEMKKALGDLNGVPASIKTIIEMVLQQVERQLLHLITEHSTMGANLIRAADVMESLDKDVSQGFNRHN